MNAKAYQRQVREMLEKTGCTPIKHTRHKHVRWDFRTPAGHPGFVITANSPSDLRGLLNLRSNVRSVIREKDNG